MSKERVYQALVERPGDFLSGEELSRELGISRAAVWKAVEGLRRQGYEIEARSGCGYRLAAGDRLGQREVAACFAAPRDNWRVLEVVDSTNTACKRLAAEGAPDGTVVIADNQTAGKGRRGRSFLSPAGMGMYLSILWRPECPPERLLPLTALSAVAVCRAIERLSGVSPAIKWPNDLVMKDRKICGILTELSLEGESGAVDSVVIGIGINANNSPEDFPEELREIAGSVYSAAGVRVCRAELAAALIMELDAMTQAWSNDPRAYLQAYRALCLTTGKEVRVLRGDTQRLAFAESVTDDFALAVRYPDGSTEALTGGEVSVRGLLGYQCD